ncbi:MAG: histidine kinase, partial [Coriobacteriales bacterium]|nr:histidine kinase [Coriobacteriales bacterium]
MVSVGDSDFQGVIDGLRAEFGFDFIALSLIAATEQPVLTWQYASGNLNNRYKRIVLASGRGIAGIIYKTGRALLLADVNREIPADEMREYPIIIAEGLGSLAAVPLWKGDDIRGILLAGFRYVNGVDDMLLQKLIEYLPQKFSAYSVDAVQTGQTGSRIERADDERPVYELMTHRVLEAQEMERRRISRELHDGLAQEILGVQMILRESKYLDSAEEKDWHVTRAIESLNSILDEVRRMAVELRPSSLDNLGLTATLAAHTAWVSNSFGVRVQFESDI